MIIFIVAGRLGKSLTISKAVPFIVTGKVQKVYIFRQEAGFVEDGVEYITLPHWIIKIRPIFLSAIVRFVYEPIQLYIYTKKYRPSLINGVFTLPKGLNSTIVGLLTQTPSMVSVIGGVVEITTRLAIPKIGEGINLWMLKKCSVISTKGKVVSEFLIQKGIDRSKIYTLNGSIDIEKFSFNPKIDKDIDIVFIGNFSMLKGPDRVLEVINNIAKSKPEIKVKMIGNGVLLYPIETKLKDYKLQKNVTLTGYIDHPERILKRSKIILIPSESEGLPTVMLEAMACGCVPIISDVGNIKEAAFNNINAFIVKDYKDIGAFTKHALQLLNNDSLRQQMALAAIKTVKEKYAPKVQASIVNEIFEKLDLLQ